MRPVFVGFDGVDQFSPEAASKFEEALLKVEKEGTKVKALVLCVSGGPLLTTLELMHSRIRIIHLGSAILRIPSLR